MPRFLTASGIAIPFNNMFLELKDGILAIPTTSTNLSDVELRTISGSGIALSGEIIFQESSGTLMISSGSSWVGLEF